ncbi:MAG: beta-galactosidase [Candidatus Eremiobacteraeota bacterium]|nr:beta-galactosidase [Candidatus Eremiobacteraeota bacterium]
MRPTLRVCLCAAVLLLATALSPRLPRTAAAATYGHSAIVQRDGDSLFEVDGKPFFVYGAAFFYERLPRDRWDAAMTRLHGLGINTLDLYVPWNWHELADGDFDFDGRTNPRRDLHEVLRLARLHGFKIILRPGPVIRNEWRNGGYPAWLLARPEYGMPLHDLLEGRYPPTATLQNAHSDDAAAEWMRNATHVRYARRWLERVLREFEPDADRVIAVALDDDQGAYLDNQTFPAPHLHAYLEWLQDVVHGITGPRQLCFINTYQMKVPASSPVWAMGNWYQSDAYALGEHDLAQLQLSFGMLQTRPHQPLMASEFQAGWLQGPDDIRPRAADPSNTALAMATMVGMGVRGIVNFPAQDTLYPAGWEVPFANDFYAWDAALDLAGDATPRYAPTAALGTLVARFGAQLAASHVEYDAAIAYLGDAYPPQRMSNADFAEIAARTLDAQRACRDAGLNCRLVDLHAISDRRLRALGILLVPRPNLPDELRPNPDVIERLARYRRSGGRIVASISPAALRHAFAATGRQPVVSGLPNVAFASDPSHVIAGFLSVANYGNQALEARKATITLPGGPHVAVPPLSIPAHTGFVVALGPRRLSGVGTAASRASDQLPSTFIPVRTPDARLPARSPLAVPSSQAFAYRADVYRDGDAAVVLDNTIVRVIVAPAAGARAFVFADDRTERNVFTTVGAMRDDVALEPPPSTADRIAKYTHTFPAGTFNRPYTAEIIDGGARAAARFTYEAPDVLPHGAVFKRDVVLAPGERSFSVAERFTPLGSRPANAAQRAVSVTSLSVGDGTNITTRHVFAPDDSAFASGTTRTVEDGNALGYYDDVTHELATIAWKRGDVEEAAILERPYSLVARLTLARDHVAHLRFGYDSAASAAAARTQVAAADAAAQPATTQGASAAMRTP